MIAEPTSTIAAGALAVRSRLTATASTSRSMPTMSGRGSRTSNGKSAEESSRTQSSGRSSRSQSISRVAAGRFTLAMNHGSVASESGPSHVPIASNDGRSPSIGKIRSGSGRPAPRHCAKQPQLDAGVANIDGDNGKGMVSKRRCRRMGGIENGNLCQKDKKRSREH